MLPLSPELLIAAASSALGRGKGRDARPLTPAEEGSPVLRDIHGPSDPVRTAAFITHAGFWAHRYMSHRSSWPFPVNADCDTLADVAARYGHLSVGSPERGALYLRYSLVEQRFTRAGIVLWAADDARLFGGWSYECMVIEGSAVLKRFGYRRRRGARDVIRFDTRFHWARRSRVRCLPFLGDRFVNWMDFDLRWDHGSKERAA